MPTLSGATSTGTGQPVTAEGSNATPLLAGGNQLVLPQATYPVLASNGDNTTGSAPNLYVINSSGDLLEYTGANGLTSDSSPLNAKPITIATNAGNIQQLS